MKLRQARQLRVPEREHLSDGRIELSGGFLEADDVGANLLKEGVAGICGGTPQELERQHKGTKDAHVPGMHPVAMMNLKLSVAEVLLWLFVLNLGIAFGAGLYEHRIVLPRWLDIPGGRWSSEAAREDDVGRRFWGFVSTGPLTLLTLASLSFAAQATGPLRSWWLVAALVALVERLLTFSYFIPTMVRLMQASDSATAVETAMRWARANHLRHALVAGAWFAALQALSWVRVPR